MKILARNNVLSDVKKLEGVGGAFTKAYQAKIWLEETLQKAWKAKENDLIEYRGYLDDYISPMKDFGKETRAFDSYRDHEQIKLTKERYKLESERRKLDDEVDKLEYQILQLKSEMSAMEKEIAQVWARNEVLDRQVHNETEDLKNFRYGANGWPKFEDLYEQVFNAIHEDEQI